MKITIESLTKYCHLFFLFISYLYEVFSEGEEGISWYIILKGSVNVVVHGKVRHIRLPFSQLRF